MHVIWIKSSDCFLPFFHNLNLVNLFGVLENGYRIPCMRNSSYNLIPILLKLYRYCDHALKVCMLFDLFFLLFLQFEFSHFLDIFPMKLRYLFGA